MTSARGRRLCGCTLWMQALCCALALTAARSAGAQNKDPVCVQADAWSRAAIPALLAGVKSKRLSTRLCALEGLRRFGDHTAIPVLVAATAEADFKIKKPAYLALSRIVEEGWTRTAAEEVNRAEVNRAVRALRGTRTNELLIKLTGDPYPDVQATAMKMLARIGDPRGPPIFFAKLFDGQYELDMAARETLKQVGKASTGLVIKALRSSAPKDQQKACWVLKWYGCDKRVEPALARLLARRKRALHEPAELLDAAAACGSPAAIPYFRRLLRSPQLKQRRLAAAALEHARRGYARQLVPLLARIMLTDKDRGVSDNVKWDAAAALGKMGFKAAIPALSRALRSRDRYLRNTAATTLQQLHDHRSLAPLLAAIRRERHGITSTEMTTAIAKNPAAPAFLARVIASGRLKAQQEALAVYSWSRPSSAPNSGKHAIAGDLSLVVPPLLQALKQKKLRGQAIAALGVTGDPRALDPLLALWSSPARKEHEYGLVIALGGLRSCRVVPPLVEVLQRHTSSGDRTEAALSLGRSGCAKAIPALVKALFDDKDEYVREKCALALRRLKDRRGLPALVKTLTHPGIGWKPRAAARKALMEFGDKSVVPALLKAVAAVKPQYRGALAMILGQIGDRRAIKPLLRLHRKRSRPPSPGDAIERALRMLIHRKN